MNTTIDAGHKYKLFSLDGECDQVLTFVKRCDLERPERFPGNLNAYPGTTLQAVIRVLIDRLIYLNNQIPDARNIAVIANMENSLWLLEDRAAERHGYQFEYQPEDMTKLPACPHCGHVVCEKIGNARKGL